MTIRRFTDEDARRLLPVPAPDSHKYSRGVVGVDTGSARFPGAAVLSCSGAARMGAGMVRYLGPDGAARFVLAARPEVVPGEGRHDVLVVGSGMAPDDPRARAGIEALQDPDGPIGRTGVIDAGALGAIRDEDRGSLAASTVLTPHAGEAAGLARALGINADLPREQLVAALADATGATVLLKGDRTLIAAPAASDHERPPIALVDSGTPYLATAGTGDVLGGIIGSLLGAGLAGPDAAALGAHLHGRAGVLASLGGVAPLVALDVADRLGEAVAAILGRAVGPAVDEGGA